MNRSSPSLSGLRFRPGQIFATPGAINVLARTDVAITDLLVRHLQGDWGDIPESDREQNELALTAGARLLSSYPVKGTRI